MSTWMEKWEDIKEKFDCPMDLESYFREKKIGGMTVDILDIGSINISSGKIITCDPFIDLEDASSYIQRVPVGVYKTKICVVPSEEWGDRYACVKVEINENLPKRYELAMVGSEDIESEIEEGEYYGFGVDAGMGCIADLKISGKREEVRIIVSIHTITYFVLCLKKMPGPIQSIRWSMEIG